MEGNHRLHEAETQPVARMSATALLDAVKALEDLVALGQGNAGALIGKHHLHSALMLRELHRHGGAGG